MPKRPIRASYLCSKCGGSTIEISETRPSLDDRYPLGHCVRCTPWPAQIAAPDGTLYQPARAIIPLVRSDAFDRKAFDRRAELRQARALVAKMQGPTGAKMSPDELREAQKALSLLMEG